MTAHLTVIPGGRNRPEVIQVERRAWDELLIARAVAATERLDAAAQERRLLLGALERLAHLDVDGAERLLTAALRLVIREATRAAADIEPGPEPIAMPVAA